MSAVSVEPAPPGDERAEMRQMVRDTVQAFVRTRGARPLSRAHRGHAPGYDPTLLGEMAELGWLGLRTSEVLGGSGLDVRTLSDVIEDLATSLLADPVAATVVLCGRLLDSAVPSPFRDRLVESLITGASDCALAWQEGPWPGEDTPLQTRLTAEGDDSYRLTGVKRFVPGTDTARGLLVTAASDAGVALVWIASDANGVTISSQPRPDGGTSATVSFGNVEVSCLHWLGAGRNIENGLETALAEATVMACAELVGISRTVMAMTVEYMTLRRQYGRPIGSFQALQHRAVDLLVQQELAVSVLDEAVTALDGGVGGSERARIVARAKARCSDAALRITREAIQLHGAIGYTDEHDLGLYLKRVLVVASWLGNGSAQRRRFAALRSSDKGGDQ